MWPGPSHGGDAALDYGIDATITGGIVVAAGQGSMAQNFGADSTQGSILVSTQEQNAAGSDIILLDADGGEILAWTMKKVIIQLQSAARKLSPTVRTL